MKVSQGLAAVSLLGCEGMYTGANCCSELRKKEWSWGNESEKNLIVGGREESKMLEKMPG